MKKLVMMAIACFAVVMADAAQCEGLTQKGERCKRDAAEGSKYCIGHADQAKKEMPAAKKEAPKAKKETPAAKKEAPKAKPDGKEKKVAAKEADDGTCWAVTEAGTRCKRKKDGEKDYCKQHAADKAPSSPFTQCRAMTYEGTQCVRKPEEGKRYCKQHMGK